MSYKILIIGPAWIGDMVLSQGLYQRLKRHTPDAEIHVGAPNWSKPLLSRMPEVSQTIGLPFKHGELRLVNRYQIGKHLRSQQYQQAIVLPRSLKSALIPWSAAIPIRTGYRGEMRYGFLNDVRRLDQQVLPRAIDRFVYLGQSRGSAPQPATEVPALVISADKRQQYIEKHKLRVEKPIVSLLPEAAFGPSKQWPAAYFAELAQQYIQRGFQVWIFGSQTVISQSIIQQIADQDEVVDLCGKTTLEDVIDLLPLSAVVVGNDSGLMHIAAATGCPVVGIYGATLPQYTPPLATQSKIMYQNIWCSPCWQRTCRYQHYHCLTKIKPDMIVSAADDLLNRKA